MAKIQLVVCDVCNDRDRPVTSYKIVRKGAARAYELCEEHAQPLEELLNSRARYTDGAARRRTATTVASMEEIEAKAKKATGGKTQ